MIFQFLKSDRLLGATNLPAGLQISPAGLISGTPTVAGNFTIPLTATSPTGIATTSTLQLSVTPDDANIAAARAAYETWRALHFPGQTASGAAGADPDGDGVGNLMEFLTGTRPNDPSSKPVPSVALDTTNHLCITLDILEPLNHGFTVSAQFATDLSFVTSLQSQSSVISGSPPGYQRILFTDPMLVNQAVKRFGRVQVSLP